MGKTYRPWNPNQQYLLPPSVQDWLPENDLVYFLLDTVNELDISAITQKQEQEKRGFPPFHPRMMAALLLYSYCRGVFSSRKRMQACQERISFKVIVGEDKKNKAASADSGYYSKLNVKFAEDKKIDTYIATKRTKHSDPVMKTPRGRPPKDLTVQEKMARKLRTRKGRKIYSKRKSIVEPVFGQIKRARGFVQFSLRCLEKMRGEWALVCLTHNLLKLFRAQYAVAT